MDGKQLFAVLHYWRTIVVVRFVLVFIIAPSNVGHLTNTNKKKTEKRENALRDSVVRTCPDSMELPYSVIDRFDDKIVISQFLCNTPLYRVPNNCIVLFAYNRISKSSRAKTKTGPLVYYQQRSQNFLERKRGKKK